MAFSYFSAKEVGEGIFQITNGIFDDTLPTFCYLVLGEKAAMLVDSMYGVGSLKEFCETLTDKPIIHVATHFHGDHTGGSYEFSEFYMSPKDFESFYAGMGRSGGNAMRTAKRRTLPEYQDQLREQDMIEPKEVRLHPIFEGDLIDLGGKQIEVIEVPGHTAGEIVLLDRKARCLYSGDTCNTNTLLQLDPKCCVAEYIENLRKLNGYRSAFDTLFNGHDIQNATIIDEGIELCEKILRHEDAHLPVTSFSGTASLAAQRIGNTMDRVDGKRFNAVYNDDRIFRAADGIHTITV